MSKTRQIISQNASRNALRKLTKKYNFIKIIFKMDDIDMYDLKKTDKTEKTEKKKQKESLFKDNPDTIILVKSPKEDKPQEKPDKDTRPHIKTPDLPIENTKDNSVHNNKIDNKESHQDRQAEKKNLLLEWKKKSGIQALVCYESSIYYSVMNLVFGVPPIVMVTAIGVIEGYSGVLGESKFFLAKIILSPLAALFKAIHLQCEYSTLSDSFKKAYNKYASIKREIDIYETMDLSEEALMQKILEIKNKIETVKELTPTPPWIVYRKYDEAEELLLASGKSTLME